MHATLNSDRDRYSEPAKLDSVRRVITQIAAIWLAAVVVIAGLSICRADPAAISNIGSSPPP